MVATTISTIVAAVTHPLEQIAADLGGRRAAHLERPRRRRQVQDLRSAAAAPE
jgi:hypothetical protein